MLTDDPSQQTKEDFAYKLCQETIGMIGRNDFIYISFVFRKYDLKGSTVDREASVKELEKDLPTLKDNDFMKEGTKIHIGEEAKQQLMETLTADVEVGN